ncbi:helix-turn-helix domain-containing protein [Agromyces sp. NPDC055661]
MTTNRSTPGLSVDELTRWALATPLRKPEGDTKRQVSVDRQRLVLIALVGYADRDGRAFPSAQRLADDIAGMVRGDVQRALNGLEASNVIARDGKAGRAVRWRVLAKLTGLPVTSTPARTDGASDGATAGACDGVPDGLPRHEQNGSEENPLRPRGIEPIGRQIGSRDGSFGKPSGPPDDLTIPGQSSTDELPSVDPDDPRSEIDSRYWVWLNDRRPDAHRHEYNARLRIARIHERRRLPLSPDELLSEAYRLGNGDPWKGVRIVDQHTEGKLDTARDPVRVVRSNLRKASAA